MLDLGLVGRTPEYEREPLKRLTQPWAWSSSPFPSRVPGNPGALLTSGPGHCPFRDRCLQHPVGRSRRDSRFHRLPHPQSLSAEHMAVPSPPRRHTGTERGTDPRGCLGSCSDPRGDTGPHWLWYVRLLRRIWYMGVGRRSGVKNNERACPEMRSGPVVQECVYVAGH